MEYKKGDKLKVVGITGHWLVRGRTYDIIRVDKGIPIIIDEDRDEYEADSLTLFKLIKKETMSKTKITDLTKCCKEGKALKPIELNLYISTNGDDSTPTDSNVSEFMEVTRIHAMPKHDVIHCVHSNGNEFTYIGHWNDGVE